MNPDETRQQLAILIEREEQEAARLLDVLEREHEALHALDPDVLLALLQEKCDLLERLESLARARGACLQAVGFPPDLEGARACLASGPQAARAALERLVAQIRACAQCNRRNGEIVLKSRQQVQAALAVLSGQPPQETGYGPSGRNNGLPSRLLASV